MMTLWQRIKEQQRQAKERNPLDCTCDRIREHGHRVATKKLGTRQVMGNRHQAGHGDPFTHQKGCPHSELQLTTKPNEYLKAKDRFHKMAKIKETLRGERARKKKLRKQAHQKELER